MYTQEDKAQIVERVNEAIRGGLPIARSIKSSHIAPQTFRNWTVRDSSGAFILKGTEELPTPTPVENNANGGIESLSEALLSATEKLKESETLRLEAKNLLSGILQAL